MIRLQQIRKVFNEGRPNEFVALDGVDLVIDSQVMTVLKGPSGSGKTTLLGIIGCMARPTAGRILLGEREVTSLPERFLTEVRRKTFGMIFQHFNLIKGLTPLENVMIPAYPEGEPYAALKQRALGLLELLDLSGKASSRIEWLSGGEAQRTAIARALINDPAIIIADEPTAHLDTRLSAEFMTIMRRLKEEGKTIIIASHDPVVCDSGSVDRVIGMRDGRIPSSGVSV
ncbi:MAG: ABC transporter ATP-binding protein [Desulfofustis sp.]|nr:ABC transporter ATP-binding protein [Desulfofustis sp.]